MEQLPPVVSSTVDMEAVNYWRKSLLAGHELARVPEHWPAAAKSQTTKKLQNGRISVCLSFVPSFFLSFCRLSVCLSVVFLSFCLVFLFHINYVSIYISNHPIIHLYSMIEDRKLI